MILTLNIVNKLKLILVILLTIQVVFSKEPSIRVKVASSQCPNEEKLFNLGDSKHEGRYCEFLIVSKPEEEDFKVLIYFLRFCDLLS